MKRHRARRSSSESDDPDVQSAAKRAVPSTYEEPSSSKLEQLVNEKVEGMMNTFFSRTRENRSDSVKGDIIIPLFDPDDRDNNVFVWLKKINQLGDIYGWDEAKRSYYMQTRLDGSARRWYNRLDNYDLTWCEWQELLKRTFPRMFEFAELIEELVGRKKEPKETMSKYFYDKLAMCRRCRFDDSAAVSCIIRGLPSELQASAKALKSTNPEELYCQFLVSMENYQSQSSRFRENDQRALKHSSNTNNTSKSAEKISNPIKCYRCNTEGHLVRDCSNPDTRLCKTCGKTGHIARFCRQNVQTDSNKIKEVKVIQSFNDLYFKDITVNGLKAIAYLDTGAQSNVMSYSFAKLLQCAIEPSDKILKGFTGSPVPALGEIKINVSLDGLSIKTSALVTHIDLGKIDILLGQPVINRDDVSLVINGNSVILSQNHNKIQGIVVENIEQRIDLVSKNSVTIPPNEAAMVPVLINGGSNGFVNTNPRYFNLADHEYIIPASVVEGSEGLLRVYNLGSKAVEFAAGQVVARGQCCSEILQGAEAGLVSQIFLCCWSNSDAGLQSQNNIAVGGFVPNFADADLTKLDQKDIRLVDASLCADNMCIGGVNLADINVGNISDGDRVRLFTILSRYSSCFASNTLELGLTSLAEMEIKLNTDRPVYHRPYRLSLPELSTVREKVKDLLEAGIIRESNSDFASPVVLVKKKNGDIRLCVDYRALNAVTIKDRFPLPIIDDEISKLTGKNFFTSLDLSQSYHQLPVSENSIHKTAFITPDGQYEYVRVPFGLANSPAVFQRLMNKIINKVNKMGDGDHILAFMDDILLPSSDIPRGLELLELLLKVLREANLKLNMKKCSFLQTELNYLGHYVSKDGIRPGDHKIKSVRDFPTPSNVHQVRQFVGLCSFFRKFIRNFSLIAKPLTDLTKKNMTWLWGEAQDRAFKDLKSSLISRPVLAIYDRNLHTELHTDASKFGVAGILLQRQIDNSLKPVMYFSRTTTREEQNYHSYELETLAVVESLKRFKVYLLGIKVKILTDCVAIRHTFVKKDLIPRIARWWLQIQEFDLEIEYRAGDKMRHVDALSRNPVDSHVYALSADDWFLTVQMQDPKLCNIINQLHGPNTNPDILNNYKISNERLYKKTLHGDRLLVPCNARWKLLQKYHDNMGHNGLKKCDTAIKEKFWFPKMTKFIRKYVTSCLDCAFRKGHYGKLEGKLNPIPKPEVPMDTLHIDHLGPFPKSSKRNQYILVITCSFSKFVIARATRTLSSAETIHILHDVFSLFGFPSTIVSDRGLAFCSRYFKNFAVKHLIKHVLTSVATPRANGQVERVNRTILNGLRTSSEESNWDSSLPDVVFGVNNTRHETTGQAPFNLMFKHKSKVSNLENSESNINIDNRRAQATANIKRKQQLMKRQFDKKRKEGRIYKKGDLVLWRNPKGCGQSGVNTKLDATYAGPYRITKSLGHDRYMIHSVKGFRGYKKFSTVVAVDSLRPYVAVVGSDSDADDADSQLDTEDLIDLLES